MSAASSYLFTFIGMNYMLCLLPPGPTVYLFLPAIATLLSLRFLVFVCLLFDSSLSSSSIFLLYFPVSHTNLNTHAPPPPLRNIHGRVFKFSVSNFGPSLSMPLKVIYWIKFHFLVWSSVLFLSHQILTLEDNFQFIPCHIITAPNSVIQEGK